MAIDRISSRQGKSVLWLVGSLVLLGATGYRSDAAERPNRFIIISDLHPYPGAFDQVEPLTQHVIGLAPAFVIVLGDIGNDEVPGASEKEIEALRESFKRIRAAGIEIFPVMGNHDVHPRVEDIKVRWFCEQGPLPLNHLFDASHATQAYRFFRAKGPYDYSFNRGGIHFVVLDSNCTQPRPDWDAERIARERPHWEAHHQWMAADLCQGANNPERLPTIIFLHHPEYMSGVRGMVTRPAYKILEQCERQQTVKAAFGGHWHYGEAFPPEANLGARVYATPPSVHPVNRPVEFIVADVHPDKIVFQPRDSITNAVREADKPVKYLPIAGRFGDVRRPGPAATMPAKP